MLYNVFKNYFHSYCCLLGVKIWLVKICCWRIPWCFLGKLEWLNLCWTQKV